MRTDSQPARIVRTAAAGGYYLVQKLWATVHQWNVLQSRCASVPVVSVGNLLMGGSGKTPFAIFLAELLQERGFKPAVVSRGYHGTNREPYLVVGDGRSGIPFVGPSVCGDEPFLMAKRLPKVPVIIGRKRIHAVEAAKRLFGCDVAVLDDGFQHLALERDADIVLLSGQEDRMFPLGGLREPFSALNRADMVVLVGSTANIPPSATQYVEGLPVFNCRQVAVSLERDAEEKSLPAGYYADRDVVLVSGIANPCRFRKTAEDLRWKVLDHVTYPDHHVLSDRDLKEVLERWSGVPVTVTEKDWVKLPEWFRNHDQVFALRIGIFMEDVDGFWQVLRRLISQPG
jgi:tetraacyldisaccharide 4'-kinase